jgi:SAM-dependent methyltransferase
MDSTKALFSAYGSYYNLLYKDKDYVGEAEYIRRVLARHGVFRGELLEFGSGTGKHGRLLAGMGYRVHGVERSIDMVVQAEQSDGFTCQQGDICAARLDRTFAAVLSLFHVISYQTSNESLNAVFSRAAEHLDVGGVFLFDFWYSPAVYAQRPSVRVRRITDDKMEITRIAEPKLYIHENRVDVSYEIFARDLSTGVAHTFTEIHPMRHLSLPEIDLLAESHGFKRVCAEEFLTEATPSEDTWSVCVTLERIKV